MSGARTLAPALRDAARMVARVADGRSLADQWSARDDTMAQTSRGALLDLTHGTLRLYGKVQAIVSSLSRRGTPDALVEALLWCSLYAIESGRYADYTVVDQAVRACGLLERWTAKGYVNGLLRTWLRERAAIEARIRTDACALHQHPKWWLEIVRRAYPRDWEQIMAAGNSHPPMTLRVNRRRATAASYAERLGQAGMQVEALGGEALRLERPVPVERLPGFEAGDVSVQDAGAQRAAGLLDLAPRQRVLDACAAPGGKSAHILERADVALTALDEQPARCERIVRNLHRLALAASVIPADCTRPQTWWNGQPFDRILADVPCTASGVARRHPDLKWLRRPDDPAAFARRQIQMLGTLWPLLAPGGKLLYVTCSVFPQENDDVVQEFMARAQRAELLPLSDGLPWQLLPGARYDGFYYALIQKQP